MKHILFCFFTTLALSGIGQINLDSGLVACYPLNGHAYDLISGYNGSPSFLGNTTDKNSTPNFAFQFTGAVNSYVQLPGNSSLKSNAVSFSAWIRSDNTINFSEYIVFTRNNLSANPGVDPAAYALILETIGTGKKIKLVKTSGTQTYTLSNNTNLNSNLWYHVCFTMDALAIKLYLNGQQTGTLSAPGNINYKVGKDVFLGAPGEAVGSSPFKGAIDNVRFYDRVLTSAEVSQLYQNDPACIIATLPPVSSFSVFSNCVAHIIQLTDATINYPHSWYWSVTGATLTNPCIPNPTLTISSPGPATVTLITSNSIATDTVIKVIQIRPLPQITIIPSKHFICLNELYTLKAVNNAMPTFTWNGSIVSPTISGSHGQVGTYSHVVAGIDTFGCSRDTTYYVKVNGCTTLSIGSDDVEKNLVKIFPNPFHDDFSVEITSYPGPGNYHVYNLVGFPIVQGKIEDELNTIIDLKTVPPGIYFLQINADGKTITRKIVKSD